MQLASGLSLSLRSIRCFRISDAHGVYGRPPSMLPPASKNVATGGPFGSNGNGAVAGSRVTPPRAGAPPPVAFCAPLAPPVLAAAAPPVFAAAAPPVFAAAAPPFRPPRPPWAASPPRPPRPRCGALLARIHTPDKSGLPSAVRGVGAS